MSILTGISQEERDAIVIDFNRPGYKFFMNCLRLREAQALHSLSIKRNYSTREDDIAALEFWRGVKSDLDFFNLLPQTFSKYLQMELPLDPDPEPLLRPSPDLPISHV